MNSTYRLQARRRTSGSRARSGLRVAVAAAVAAGLSGCTSTPATPGVSTPSTSPGRTATSAPTAQTAPTQTDPGHPCPLSAKLVPSCGVLVGVTTDRPVNAALDTAEQGLPRPYDFVYRFHRVTGAFPTAEETALVQSGRALHISVDTPPDMTWAQVADGEVDQALREQALGVAKLRKPVWMTFDHEPDNPSKTSLGSGADFVRAWRHVREIYTKAGATNAVWVWVMIGTGPGLVRAETMWPGNDQVDWISWDVYNASGCRTGTFKPERWQSFEASFEIFRTWLVREGPRLGIDTTKPWMISETGTVDDPSDPQRRVDWYRQVPQVLAKYPQVKAVGFWDHTGNAACDYRFSGSDAVMKEIGALVESAGKAQ